MPARSPEQAAFGEAVRQLREQAGLTQEGLSEIGGVSDYRRLGELERGQGNPRFLSLLKLCSALDIAPTRLWEVYEEVMAQQKQKGGG
jgi:transcriptional regulator with XRE-family HTH domain